LSKKCHKIVKKARLFSLPGLNALSPEVFPRERSDEYSQEVEDCPICRNYAKSKHTGEYDSLGRRYSLGIRQCLSGERTDSVTT
jgi:hypothetical protein